jgi:uncharacterized protein with PIN domain
MVDAMLGRLARWLRMLGFDAAYEPDVDDESLVRRAVEERRIILTRDRLLAKEWRVGDLHVMASERPMEQLREIAQRFALAQHVRPFTRCSRCNVALREATGEQAAGDVPLRVLERDLPLRRCPDCGRFYWMGSHVKRMQRMMQRALGQ